MLEKFRFKFLQRSNWNINFMEFSRKTIWVFLVTKGNGDKYHVPCFKFSPFIREDFPMSHYYKLLLFVVNVNSLVISIFSIHWVPEMMAERNRLKLILKSANWMPHNAVGTRRKLFYDFHFFLLRNEMVFLRANDSWWISFRWSMTVQDEAGEGWWNFILLRRFILAFLPESLDFKQRQSILFKRVEVFQEKIVSVSLLLP